MNARVAIPSFGLLLSCSTVAPLPTPNECNVDEDCDTIAGEVCAPDTRVCVPGSALPPRADLAFDIQEPQGFRVEISGCDCDVTQQSANNQLSLDRDEVMQTFELAIYSNPDVDPTMPMVGDLLPAKLQLTATTRFAAASQPTLIDYPTLTGEEGSMQLVTTSVRWPRYHPYDVLPPGLARGGRVVWRSTPEMVAPIYRLLRPPMTFEDKPCTTDDECKSNDPRFAPTDPNFCYPGVGECTLIGGPTFAYAFTYNELCDRRLKGSVVQIDPDTLEEVIVSPAMMTSGIPDARVTIRHADIENAARLGEFALSGTTPDEREDECTSDAQCATPDEFCETVTNQCVLALAGRSADNGNIQTDAVGAFSAQVNSYCEYESNDLAFDRAFTVTVAPPASMTSAAPAVNFTFTVPFRPAEESGDIPDTQLPGKLCVPDWGPPSEAVVDLKATPITLVGEGPDAFRCCDVSCLPATPEDAAALSEPPRFDSCDGRTLAGDVPQAIVDTPFKLTPAKLDAWEEAGCVRPTADVNDIVGGIRSDSIPCNATDSTCVLPGLASGLDGGTRDYGLRLESPVGSLFRSDTFTLQIGPESATTPVELPLIARVLVRGRVRLDNDTCDAAAPVDGDCGSEGAVVFAERLRMPGEDTDRVLGPYFHSVSTYYDPVALTRGAFVLPLDPGVYLLTALPITGSLGGPAEISVIDLREGQDLEDVDLVLKPGVIVTLDFNETFDRSTQVVPLDVASWVGLPDPDGRLLDLNAPGECLSVSTDGRCRIRRLIAGASITGSQVGQVRFNARAHSAASSCNLEMKCPER
ncbi:MAG TPA: hypothetical protein VG755_34930 [Nannocystaceae bacterium]|nr:hypothetical protein [Nannocystaceae bacterium]